MAKAKPEQPKDVKTSKQSTLAGFFAPKPITKPTPKPAHAPSSSPVTTSLRTPSSVAGSSPVTSARPPARSGSPLKKSMRTTEIASEDELTPPPESGPSSAAKNSSGGRKSVKEEAQTDEDIEMEDDDSPVVSGRRTKRKVVYVDPDSDDSDAVFDEPKSKPSGSKGRKPRKSMKEDSDSDEFVFDAADDAALAAAAEDYEATVLSVSPSPERSPSPIARTKSKPKPKSTFTAPKAVPKKSTTSWNASSPMNTSRPGPHPLGNGTPSRTGSSGALRDSGYDLLTQAEKNKLDARDAKREKENTFSFLEDVRDRDGNRPEDPEYDNRTINIPKSSWAEFTPFEKQFWEIKQDHYDTVLFFQKGKFYELYEDDAIIGHQEFDLKLTDRVKMKMVGVPEQSLEFWIQKFIGAGHKVGIVQQAETAIGMEMRTKGGGKEIVRRELAQVFTNGTIVDGTYLNSDEANHCVSIKESVSDEDGLSSFGICVMDASTGHFDLSEFQDDICRTKLETLFRQVRPRELLHVKGNLSVDTSRLLRNILPGNTDWQSFKDGKEFYTADVTIQKLTELYATEDDEVDADGNTKPLLPDNIGEMLEKRLAMEALGGMMYYLKMLNQDKDLLSQKNFNIYDPMREGKNLVLDGQTLGHMEVLVNNEGGTEGTLLELLQRCQTPFGKRLFRLWLTSPLREASAINDRLDAVEDLMNHPSFSGNFTRLCKGLPDLERLLSRIHAGSLAQSKFLSVVDSFTKVKNGFQSLASAAESFVSQSVPGLLRTAPDLSSNLVHIKSMYTEFEGEKTIEILPTAGADEACDTANAEVEEIEAELDELLEDAKRLLKEPRALYWHSAQGGKEIYQIQVPAGAKNKVPSNWTKSGGTKDFNRYYTPKTIPVIRRLQEARETLTTAKRNFYKNLLAEFDKDRTEWLKAIKVLAELDCLVSLAKASSDLDEPKCRPEFVESKQAFIDFEDLRHPSMCLRSDFISNNVQLGNAQPRQVLLTGPNMAGKSTLLRMTAAGVIMAQLGCYVPAASARLSPVDRIQTRMGAYDNMFASASTFKVELDECSKILREAGPRSLVILDELGRGTSTFDGMAIAGAVLHHLATHTLPLGFFATHYGSLTDDFHYHPNIRNMHMKTHVDDEQMQVVFLYKLIPGVAESSHGTHVARMAGVPNEVVLRAESVSDQFFQDFKAKLVQKRQSALPLVAQADFAWLMKLVKASEGEGKSLASLKEQLEVVRRAIGKYETS
ncbi:hypothetical protein CI109_106804 [Kwoniella shandongensis]|uniref:DNA mismatch repair protein n=1 Tax=Kwoniella shandongensis TaxID=1734106 RepID=A0A5M6CCC7_9TREE|nr:uncharacterized protein CI109_000939 [Kwoniella shandongensis]KAA5530759.1 hypothetical protein CI109_000939 [Kwoniella shandongensis]